MTEDALFEQACQLFNESNYFEAHEVWEELWNESTGPRHAYLQGLIQVAAGLLHAQNENWVGTRKLFSSALSYLAQGAPEADEIDVVQLKELILDFEIALQKKLSGDEVTLPFFQLPRK